MNFMDDSGNVGTDAVTVAEEIFVAPSIIIPVSESDNSGNVSENVIRTVVVISPAQIGG